MKAFLAIVVTAMIAQLAVLPGEKVQFLIAGLATRYRPLTVVSAAGLAFAGWTALEIWFGQALKGALPPVYLDAISGALFLLFGVLLLRSMPGADESIQGALTDGGSLAVPDEPDGSASGNESTETAEFDGDERGDGATTALDVTVFGYEVPDRFGTFLPIFAMMATGEFGDKTQLVTIGLAVQYGAHPGIWVGEMLAIIPVSLANAYFFNRFAHRFDLRLAHAIGAGIFLFFGLDTYLSIATGFSVWETVVSTVSNVILAAVHAVLVAVHTVLTVSFAGVSVGLVPA